MWCKDDDEVLKVIEYNLRNSLTHSISSSLFIPQKLHFIWLGSALKPIHERIINSWRVRHPGWEVCIWNDENTAAFSSCEAFSKCSNFGMKSDLLRYKILHSLGGVYADVDFECIASIDQICSSSSFFAGISNRVF